jgi:IS4 transposase
MSARGQRKYQEQLDLATPQEWTDLVPKDILAEVAAEHGGDLADGKLSAPVHFWVMVVATLSRSYTSLKGLLSGFQARFGSVFGLPKDKDKPWVSAAALSQRNKERPVAFWQAMYQKLRQHHFGGGWLKKVWQKKFTDIEALDSSTFNLVARLRHIFAPSGSGGSKKGSWNPRGALKIHQVFNAGSELPAQLGIGEAREHDAKAWKRVLKQIGKGVLYLIDRGYCSFDFWWAIEQAGSYFLTPLKSNIVYVHARWLNHKRERDHVKDSLIRIPGMDRGLEFVLLRLVEIRQPDGTWWRYVTNMLDASLTPADIAELYSLRWRIEIFFRHLKHTLNMEHWFTQSEAGVQAQLYAALIGYLLSQVVLLWASREARRAPEQYRFAIVVQELAAWLVGQLYDNRLLLLAALIARVRRNASEIDKRRNSQYFQALPA